MTAKQIKSIVLNQRRAQSKQWPSCRAALGSVDGFFVWCEPLRTVTQPTRLWSGARFATRWSALSRAVHVWPSNSLVFHASWHCCSRKRIPFAVRAAPRRGRGSFGIRLVSAVA